MVLTNEMKTSATGFVENVGQPKPKVSLPAATKKRILNSAVRLTGVNQDNDLFNGSGVIVNAKALGNQKYEVTILSALHNVSVWGGANAPDIPSEDAIAAFAKKMQVNFGEADLAFNSKPGKYTELGDLVPDKQIAGTGAENSYYDLLVLKCGHKGLYEFAKTYVFNNQDNTLPNDVKEFPKNADNLLRRNQYAFVQLGFGQANNSRKKFSLTNDKKVQVEQVRKEGHLVPKEYEAKSNVAGMADHSLHYRVTVPLARAITYKKAYDLKASAGEPQAYLTYEDPILLMGRQTSTTAKGDSGGPLYAINRTAEKIGDVTYEKYTKAYLIGVTSGADMELAEKICPMYTNCVSTSVSAYFESKRG